jgi:hypothetical protein
MAARKRARAQVYVWTERYRIKRTRARTARTLQPAQNATRAAVRTSMRDAHVRQRRLPVNSISIGIRNQHCIAVYLSYYVRRT